METIVIIGAGASGLACMNELVKTNKYNKYLLIYFLYIFKK